MERRPPLQCGDRSRADLEGGTSYYGFELRGDSSEEYKVKLEEASVGSEHHHFKVENGKWIDGPAGLKPPLDDKNLALPIIGGDVRFRPLVQALQHPVSRNSWVDP
jgi:hypothetical protein